ncbi:putative multiple-sugar transport system permease YteP [Streptomyces violarus]
MATALRERAGTKGVDPSRGDPEGVKRERKGFQSRTLFLLMLPGVAYFLLFHYGALVGNVIAFKEYVPFDGLWGSPWVGLGNFQRMFEDAAFWDSVLNTLWLSVLQLVFYFPVPLGLALLLHSLTWSTVRRFVQSVAYLPHFISWVIVVALFQQVLGDTGLLNSRREGPRREDRVHDHLPGRLPEEDGDRDGG